MIDASDGKECVKCKHVKALDHFYDDQSTCKPCARIVSREYQRKKAADRKALGTKSTANGTHCQGLPPGVGEQFRRKKRPVCPSCSTAAPGYVSSSWGLAWGHRCPHGEPCPGWEAIAPSVSTCRESGCKCIVKERVVA